MEQRIYQEKIDFMDNREALIIEDALTKVIEIADKAGINFEACEDKKQNRFLIRFTVGG